MTRKVALLIASVLMLACSRKVVVTTPTTASTSIALKVTNDAAQTVTVMVESAGTQYTIGAVPAKTTAVLVVNQVALGSTVKLRASLADGSQAFTRDGVVLTGTYEWRVP